MRKIMILVTLLSLSSALLACGDTNGDDDPMDDPFKALEPFELTVYDPFTNPLITTPERSTFFATVQIEDRASYDTFSDGDLWPMAWSDDGYLYTANGDGKGFDMGSFWQDIVVNRLSGHPDTKDLRGNKIVTHTPISQVWSHPDVYNRKPTGMASVDGNLYLAVQDLNKFPSPGIFNDAPNATIIRSNDKGVTWQWDSTSAMFKDYMFTTIMFLDYGQDGADNIFDDYVYAYGMDYNWRDSFNNSVPDPTHLYLARMPKTGIQDLSTWEFYTGDLHGNASWSSPGEIESRSPVLTDQRRVYGNRIGGVGQSMSVLSQGSIVYNKAIERYIYTSWTEYTFEFYESQTPWGPWRHFMQKDFGAYPWSNNRYGGYATVIPSKFISEDGLRMWVQSNTFAGQIHKYNLSLRQLNVTLHQETVASNIKSDDNLANPSIGSNPVGISVATHLGLFDKLNSENKTVWDTSFNDRIKTYDYWGITWNQQYTMNELVYTTGRIISTEGGWFENFKVQVRQNHQWVDVENAFVSTNYTFNNTQKSFEDITITFDAIDGDGIRLIGIPGGPKYYTSAAELEVYYRDLTNN